MISKETIVTNLTYTSGTTVYTALFKILSESDLKVIHVHGTTGVETELTLNTDFSVSNITEDATEITMISSYDDGTLSIQNDTAYTQATKYITGSDFPAATHEKALDRLTILAIQNRERIDRTLQLPLTESSESLVFPNAETRKNSYLHFTDTGAVETDIGPVPHTYNDSYSYLKDDIVQYNGVFYIALQSNTGNTPGGAGNVYWRNKNFNGITYQDNIYYYTDEIVSYNGYLFKSLIDDNNNTPTLLSSDTAWEVVRTSIEWKEGINYLTDDLVQYNGLVYKALQNSRGQAPTLSGTDAYWIIIPSGMDWYANAAYSEYDHVEYQGYIFKSLIVGTETNKNNTPSVPDGDANWERIITQGSVGTINPWDSGTTYSKDSVVSYNGEMFISLQSVNLNNQPDTETTWWRVWPYRITVSTSDPSGGVDGDIWYKREV